MSINSNRFNRRLAEMQLANLAAVSSTPRETPTRSFAEAARVQAQSPYQSTPEINIFDLATVVDTSTRRQEESTLAYNESMAMYHSLYEARERDQRVEEDDLPFILSWGQQNFNPESTPSELLDCMYSFKTLLYHSALIKYVLNLAPYSGFRLRYFLYSENFLFGSLDVASYDRRTDCFISSSGESYKYGIVVGELSNPYSYEEYLQNFFEVLRPDSFTSSRLIREFSNRDLRLISGPNSENLRRDLARRLPPGAGRGRAFVNPWVTTTRPEVAGSPFFVSNSSSAIRVTRDEPLEKLEIVAKKTFDNPSIEDVLDLFSDLFSNMGDIFTQLQLPSENTSQIISGLQALETLFNNKDPKVLYSLSNIPDERKAELLKTLRNQSYDFIKTSQALKLGSLNKSLSDLATVKYNSLSVE